MQERIADDAENQIGPTQMWGAGGIACSSMQAWPDTVVEADESFALKMGKEVIEDLAWALLDEIWIPSVEQGAGFDPIGPK